MGFEEVQSDLEPLPFKPSFLPPPFPNTSKLPKVPASFGKNEKTSTNASNMAVFDESLLPSVPSNFEDSETAHPASDENDEDYFENIKRRFSALKKRQY